jgi:uncharacterized membrane protein
MNTLLILGITPDWYPYLIVVGLFCYFIPWLIGFQKKRSNLGAIFVLNLLLGWTFVGWVAALIWAVSSTNVVRKETT